MWSAVILFAVLQCLLCQELSSQPEKLTLSIVDLANANGATRIIGGTETTIEKYPFAVQVRFSAQLICGGSLLTSRHVLSAAHCFVDERGNVYSTQYFSIRAGSASQSAGGSIREVSTIIVHESYNSPALDNDIAVLVLSSAVSLGTTVAVASIPTQGATLVDNSTVVHVGWGLTNASDEGSMAQVLNEVAVYTINQETCAARYGLLQNLTGEPMSITSSMLCAGILDVGGKDACQGDSGGPLIYNNNIVVGVVSWGVGCAEPFYPGVNARVSSYTNWINDTVTRYNNANIVAGTKVLLLSSIIALVLTFN